MKKTSTFNDLSTSIQSLSQRFNQITQVRSTSLQRAIYRLKQDNRVSIMGIGTISNSKIPKNRSYFEIKSQQQHKRISNPSEEPKISGNVYDQKKEAIKRITQLQQYCKSQDALELATQKYSIKKSFKGTMNLTSIPTVVDKLNKDVLNKQSNIMKDIMKEELRKRLPKRKKEISYELDSMFSNYKSFPLRQQNDNKLKGQNGYLNIYNSEKNEPIKLKQIQEKKQSLSDESQEYQNFIEEVDEAIIQRDVYNSNIRNPFLDDKITVKQMKKDGFLKRRITQS